MCASLPAWMCLLLGFLPLEVQSRALPLQTLMHRQRSSLPRTSKYPKPIYTAFMPPKAGLPAAVNHHHQGDRQIILRAPLHKETPPRLSDVLFGRRDRVIWEAPVSQHGSRGRRHAKSDGGIEDIQLRKKGCVLSTCQFQNFNQQLYDLIKNGPLTDTTSGNSIG